MKKLDEKILDALEGEVYRSWLESPTVRRELTKLADVFLSMNKEVDVCPSWTTPESLKEFVIDIVNNHTFTPLDIPDGASPQVRPMCVIIDAYDADDWRYCATPEIIMICETFDKNGNPMSVMAIGKFTDPEEYEVRTQLANERALTKYKEITNMLKLSLDRPFILFLGDETEKEIGETIELHAALEGL